MTCRRRTRRRSPSTCSRRSACWRSAGDCVPAADGRTLGVALAFAWLAYPFTLYTMNANANDSLIAATVVGAMLVLTSPPARGAMVALGAAAKFGSAALAPLFATGTGERRWRSAILFAIAFVAVTALLVVPFLPNGGLHEFYDRTLGYQASRSSPFSVWGLAPSLDFLRPVVRAGAIALAFAVALWPARKTPAQVAALAAAVLIAVQVGATHWFYFYVVWFLPLVLAAPVRRPARRGPQPILVSSRAQGRRADHDLVAGLQPDAGLAGAADARRACRWRRRRRARASSARERCATSAGHREDQVVGGRRLHLLAVQGQRERDRVVGPGLVGRHQGRAAGRRAVEHLARHPLRGRELQVAGREVVEEHVAGDVVERLGLGDVLRAPRRPRTRPRPRSRPCRSRRAAARSRPARASALRNLAKKVGASGGSIPASAAWAR